MLRFVRVYYKPTESRIVYYAKNPVFISAYKRNDENFSPTVSGASYKTPNVFNDCIVIDVPAFSERAGRCYECVVYVSENQPVDESIEEITSVGVAAQVFNENGVMVCDNGITPLAPSTYSSPTSGVPGEMTSEPIDGPGEML